MSGRYGIPSAKEAKALLKGVVSSSQKKKGKRKKKRKRMPDTRVVDDLEVYELSKVEATFAPMAIQAGTSLASASIELSPAKSPKKGKVKVV